MKETIKSIIEWHEQTFPDATLEGQIEKFGDELSEYGESECLEELADLFIVACGIARFDFIKALPCFAKAERLLKVWEKISVSRRAFEIVVNEKMQTNRQRKWGKIGNKFQHIEEGK
jgi:predicted house-cleaning noncanonical NTP pyrophosphatase (MazG superfamily)